MKQMNWFWLNMPLAAAFFGAWVGIPMRLVFKRPDRGCQPLAVDTSARSPQAGLGEPQIVLAPQRGEHLAGVP
jgi:hypothetical protein